jgi:hypothetical protein
MTTRIRSVAAGLALLAGLLIPANAADRDLSNYLPVCDGKFGLCRYIDRNTKQELLSARYERALPFSEGLAAVRVNGRFGYIDQRGEIMIAPQFDLGGEFYQGLAEVVVGTRAGVIDRSGRVIVRPQFQRAVPLTSDVIVAIEGEWRRVHYEGSERLYGIKFGRLENAGLYHIDGRWIRRPGGDLRSIAAFDTGRGLVWATMRGDRADLIGLMASDGSWVVEPQYNFASMLGENRAVVAKRIDGVMHSGAVDGNGQLVVPLGPRQLSYWSNGQAIVQEGPGRGRQALVDQDGNIIGGRWFDKVERAGKSGIAIVWDNGRAVGLDRAGNIVPNPNNGRVIATCPGGVRVVEIDGLSQITDASGTPTSPHLFKTVFGRLPCDKPFSVSLNGKWGYVGVDGRVLFDPPRFDNQHEFSDGYAVVYQGGKWGIIDTSGSFTVDATFDGYAGSRDGLFRMKRSGRDVWIDASGNEKAEPPVRWESRGRALDCGHGVRLFSRDGLWGIVDGDKEIIAPKYRAIICFKNGVASAPIDSRRQWCPLDPDGVERGQPVCTTTNYPEFWTHSVPEKFADDPFENSVLWSRAYLEFAAGRRDSPPRWVSDRMR